MLRTSAFLVLLFVLSSCNAFSWAASVDDSEDYGLLMAEARAQMAAGCPDKAVEYFTRALSLRTNDILALDGRVEARLLLLTSGRSVYTAFPSLFITNGSSDTSLFPHTPTRLADIFPTALSAVRDVDLLDTLLSPTNAIRTARLTADAAVATGLAALLTLADSNSNGIPCESADTFLPTAAFTVSQSGPAPNPGIVATAQRYALTARVWLDRLESATLPAMRPGTPLSAFRFNLVRFVGHLSGVTP